MPDRLVLMPGGKMCFMEIKAFGKRPRPLQARCIDKLRVLGFKVFVVDGKEQIGGILDAL